MTQEPGASSASPSASPSDRMARIIDAALARAGGWLPFDQFMALALYAPGAGYYAHGSRKFGHMPASGSDFVTAPELTPLFGQTVAAQVGEALTKTGTQEVWEFGAGSGALAAQLLETLSDAVQRYTIVDLSGSLRARQQETLAAWGDRVRWADQLPERFEGVVVGNEVLDAMPVKLLVRKDGRWHERGVYRTPEGPLSWIDWPTELRPPVEIESDHDYLTEIHPQARAWIGTLAERLQRGAVFLFDYGFPEAEYYHPQRHMGTVMCHQGHQADSDPLTAVGDKDITAHVDFTGIALAGQDAGLHVLGYTSQARFLINAGLLSKMEQSAPAQRALAAHLIHEHEMGELFKVIGFAAAGSAPWDALGFREGDRSHTL
jgi:SAM-dependent MidA family methyltransferase